MFFCFRKFVFLGLVSWSEQLNPFGPTWSEFRTIVSYSPPPRTPEGNESMPSFPSWYCYTRSCSLDVESGLKNFFTLNLAKKKKYSAG